MGEAKVVCRAVQICRKRTNTVHTHTAYAQCRESRCRLFAATAPICRRRGLFPVPCVAPTARKTVLRTCTCARTADSRRRTRRSAFASVCGADARRNLFACRRRSAKRERGFVGALCRQRKSIPRGFRGAKCRRTARETRARQNFVSPQTVRRHRVGYPHRLHAVSGKRHSHRCTA